MQPIFHLAFPVVDLLEAEVFYHQHFKAKVGRRSEQWIDIVFFGHQITLHQRPEQVLSAQQVGVRHFGVILGWADWQELAASLEKKKLAFKLKPNIKFKNTEQEQAKLLLADPSGNLIEIKSYKNINNILNPI